MKLSNYPRGSEWRKWDLQVHTPASITNGYKDNWTRYLNELESLPREFKVLGINDYLFLDGYRRLFLEKENNNRLKNIDLLLPVVEFRIAKFAGIEFKKTTRINLHVIFSNELTPDVIEAQFLNALQSRYRLDPGASVDTWGGTITRESLERLGQAIKASVPLEKLTDFGSDLSEGFNNLNIEEAAIFETLEGNSFLRGKYLTALGKSEWDKLNWSDGSIAEKKDIINRVSLIFTSAETADNAIASRDKLLQQKVNSRLLDCSDAHYFYDATYKDRIGKCFTWIKADPTFDGLKEVVYEPTERSRLQDTNPARDYPKSYFSRLTASGSVLKEGILQFSTTDIPLNANLVTLIGGRGSGKSILLDVLFKVFSNQSLLDKRLQAIGCPDFSVSLTKSDGSIMEFVLKEEHHNFDYLHVRQGEVKRIADDPNELAKEIMSLLGGLNDFSDPPFEERQVDRIEKIVETARWLKATDDAGNRIHTTLYHQKRKESSKKLIDTLTTEETKAQIESHAIDIRRSSSLLILEQRLERLKTHLADYADKTNAEINEINEAAKEANQKISNVDFKLQVEETERLTKWCEVEREKCRSNAEKLEIQLREKGLKGDLSGILDKVEEYQLQITQSDNEMEEINKKNAFLRAQWQALFETGEAIKTKFEKECKDISEAFESKLKGSESALPEHKALIKRLLNDITIEGTLFFDGSTFYKGLLAFLDGRKFRKRGIEHLIALSCENEFIELITNGPTIRLDEDPSSAITLEQFVEYEDYFRDGADQRLFLEYFYCESNRKNYLRVIPKISYHGKSPGQLSVGQRGTLYVCLKLATDLFTPFVFDQPEDDLDNEFIMEELRPIFLEIKKYRQVIIATHNANLVVNADSEQVIVAHNDFEVLSYTSGALEHTSGDYNNPGIRENVCKILEGGEDAFRQREKKYGMLE